MTQDRFPMNNLNGINSYCPMMHHAYFQPQAVVQPQMMPNGNIAVETHNIGCSGCPMKPMQSAQDPYFHNMMRIHEEFSMNPYIIPSDHASMYTQENSPDQALRYPYMMPPNLPQMMVELDVDDEDSYVEDREYYDEDDSSENINTRRDDINHVLREIERNNPAIFGTLNLYGIPYPIARKQVARIIRLTLQNCK